MTHKVFKYGVGRLLAVALLVGVGYIALNPTEVAAQSPIGDLGQGRGRSEGVPDGDGTADGIAAYGQGQGGQGRGQGRGQKEDGAIAAGQSAFDGRGRTSGTGQGRNETVRDVTWETLTGTVLGIDHEVTLQTTVGEVLVGMGQSAYWADFEITVGDTLTVLGFYEDGEFKAGTVENTSTGASVTLRAETGRPIWAGRGQLKNQS